MIFPKSEENAYNGQPLERMKLQDAMIVVGVYALREMAQKDSDVVEGVAKHVRHHPLFENTIKGNEKDLETRINRIINHMRTEQPQTLLSRAARTMTEKQRETAFELAAAILADIPDASAENQAVREQLRLTLAIP